LENIKPKHFTKTRGGGETHKIIGLTWWSRSVRSDPVAKGEGGKSRQTEAVPVFTKKVDQQGSWGKKTKHYKGPGGLGSRKVWAPECEAQAFRGGTKEEVTG